MMKKEIRKIIKEKKKQLLESNQQMYSDIIIKKCIDLDVYKNSNTLFSYIHFNQEVKTDKLIKRAWQDSKKVAVPKVLDDNIEFYYINTFKELKKGYYNILEPLVDRMAIPNDNAIIIMPGLAFDKHKNRIGYGGGFYDRYLSINKNIIKIALAYDFQIFDSLPVEPNDVKVDIVITEKRIIL